MPIYTDTKNMTNTKSGTPSITFNSKLNGISNCSIYGNEQQAETPSPDNIIMPDFCGVRTRNLFDKTNTTIYNAYIDTSNIWRENEDSRSIKFLCLPNTQYTLSVSQNLSLFRIYETSDSSVVPSSSTVLTRIIRSQDRKQSTFTTGANTEAIVFQGTATSVDTWFNSLMINTGSTALPYEPYGWAEKIICAGQTTPVYLGQTQTIRKIHKLVITGDEGWGYTSGMHRITITENLYLRNLEKISICSHYETVSNQPSASLQNNQLTFLVSSSGNNYMYIRDTRFTDTNNFKAYLSQQYSNGTPVTVWYVLAETKSDIVNEPLCKIEDYVDELTFTNSQIQIPTIEGINTLSVDTTLAPSNIEINYTLPDYSKITKIYGNTSGNILTKSGTSSISFHSKSGYLNDYSIFGNGQQTETPTPDNIIMPTFCGKLVVSDWTVPITCAGQTTPVYLGQVQTVRQIKKLVLTGDESEWNDVNLSPDTRYFRLALGNINYVIDNACVCSHFVQTVITTSTTDIGFNVYRSASQNKSFVAFRPGTNVASYLDRFKAYLAQQYANGTPVTVWYVLSTPEIGIVNEPLAKIGNYADELSYNLSNIQIPVAEGLNTLTIDSELPPSETTITYQAQDYSEISKIFDNQGRLIYTNN